MTDYRQIHDPARREHYVYRLINKRGRLLYVGCTMNLKGRIGEHYRNGRFGHLIATTEHDGPYSYAEARHIEKAAILKARPPFNTEWLARDSNNVPIPRRARVA